MLKISEAILSLNLVTTMLDLQMISAFDTYFSAEDELRMILMYIHEEREVPISDFCFTMKDFVAELVSRQIVKKSRITEGGEYIDTLRINDNMRDYVELRFIPWKDDLQKWNDEEKEHTFVTASRSFEARLFASCDTPSV